MKKKIFMMLFFVGVVLYHFQVPVESVFNQLVTQKISQQLGVAVPTAKGSEQKNVSKLTYDGTNQVVVINQNKPTFTSEELCVEKDHWLQFSNLDGLNRVGKAEALLSFKSLSTKKRTAISSVKPTGWRNKKIIFNGKQDYLYNRCHLIAFELCGENANAKNLLTGTRALNANFSDEKQSMVYYENLIAQYIRKTNHHVRYRVIPIFKESNLVASGVEMQAQSIEDQGVSFHVYIFNVQSGYEINYADGTSLKK